MNVKTKAAYGLAKRNEKLNTIPAFPPRRPENNARRGFFDRSDFLAVLEHIGVDDLRDYLEWFYWTGMRPGEITSLTWDDYDRETNVLRLHESHAKKSEGRMLALVGPVLDVVERRISARLFGVDLIFHRAGNPIKDFYKRWHRAIAKAGCSGRLPYDLRRTAVRNLIRAGVDATVARSISGHKTRSMFQRYNITDERDVERAFQATADYVSSLPHHTEGHGHPLQVEGKMTGTNTRTVSRQSQPASVLSAVYGGSRYGSSASNGMNSHPSIFPSRMR